MNKIFATLRLIRVPNGLIAVLSLIVAVYLASGNVILLWRELSALFFVVSFGFAINDLFDQVADRVSKTDRPLPSGRVSTSGAIGISLFCLLAGLTLAAAASLTALIYFFVLASLLFLYSYRLSKMLIVSNLVVATLCSSVFPFAGLICDWVSPRWLLLVAAFIFSLLHHFAREIIKDMADIDGDRRINRKSTPLVWGEGNAIKISAAAILLLVLSTYIFYFLLEANLYFLLLVTLGVNLPLLLMVWLMLRNRMRPSRVSSLAKLTILPGLAALVVCGANWT